jgi:hypothetical protein
MAMVLYVRRLRGKHPPPGFSSEKFNGLKPELARVIRIRGRFVIAEHVGVGGR